MRENFPTHVYAIECAGHVKIGVAEDARTRLAALNLTCPLDMTLRGLRVFPCRSEALAAEKAIHIALSAQRLKGEWFALSPVDPCALLYAMYPDATVVPAPVVPKFNLADAIASMQMATFYDEAPTPPAEV